MSQTHAYPDPLPPPAKRKSRTRRWLVPGVAALVLIWGTVGAVISLSSRKPAVSAIETAEVRKGQLNIVVAEGGALQAERMERIRSQVKEGVKIISIVPEGTTISDQDVKDGKILVALDSTSLKDRLDRQKVTVESAEADLTKTREDFKIQEMDNDTNVRSAELNLKFARADLESYLGKELSDAMPEQPDFASICGDKRLGGVALQKKRQLENDMSMAVEEVERAKVKYDWTQKLYAKKYVTENEKEADRLALLRQEAVVEQQKLAMQLFVTYEAPKEAETRFSALCDRLKGLERVKSRANSQIAQATARLRSSENILSVQRQSLTDLQKQVEACTIRATKPGLVVYASSTDFWRRSRNPIEEGAQVWERQEIINLPDMASLVAQVRIHESVVKKVKPGQEAAIFIDAYPDLRLHGRVKDVAPLPDPQQMNQDTKVFITTITVDGDYSYLKPGISCRAEIRVATLADVVYVPAQSVSVLGDSKVCYVVGPDGAQSTRTVVTGDFDDKFVEIKSGLNKGERVLLNPPMVAQQEQPEDAKKAEATQKPEELAAPPAQPAAPVQPATAAEPAVTPESANPQPAERPARNGGRRSPRAAQSETAQ